MAAPASRVLTAAKLPHLRPVQDAFNATTHAGGCLVFCQPDRLQDAQREVCIDLLREQFANHWICVCRERVCPLLSMLWICPLCFACIDVRLGALFESHAASGLGLAAAFIQLTQRSRVI